MPAACFDPWPDLGRSVNLNLRSRPDRAGSRQRTERKMSEMVYKVPGSWSACAHIDAATYHEMYAKSVRDPENFWGEHGKRID